MRKKRPVLPDYISEHANLPEGFEWVYNGPVHITIPFVKCPSCRRKLPMDNIVQEDDLWTCKPCIRRRHRRELKLANE